MNQPNIIGVVSDSSDAELEIIGDHASSMLAISGRYRRLRCRRVLHFTWSIAEV